VRLHSVVEAGESFATGDVSRFELRNRLETGSERRFPPLPPPPPPNERCCGDPSAALRIRPSDWASSGPLLGPPRRSTILRCRRVITEPESGPRLAQMTVFALSLPRPLLGLFGCGFTGTDSISWRA